MQLLVAVAERLVVGAAHAEGARRHPGEAQAGGVGHERADRANAVGDEAADALFQGGTLRRVVRPRQEGGEAQQFAARVAALFEPVGEDEAQGEGVRVGAQGVVEVVFVHARLPAAAGRTKKPRCTSCKQADSGAGTEKRPKDKFR